MKRTMHIITAAIFCLFIAGFGVLHLILPDRSFSPTENRNLADKSREGFKYHKWKEMPNMRIDAYNQVAQLYKTNKTGKVATVSNVASARDEVQISSSGRDYQIAKQAVQEASDIRADKVAELKAKVNAGKYHVDNGDFANKLLAKYNALV